LAEPLPGPLGGQARLPKSPPGPKYALATSQPLGNARQSASANARPPGFLLFFLTKKKTGRFFFLGFQ
jgi:hypothetical protein